MSTISGSSSKAISKLHSIKKDSKSSIQDLTKDDFIVGDKVFIASNPDRLGTVAFNGTTKFSEGIWIGVVLDKPFGKNNGVVQGVKYFLCEENHGIFVRSNNLRHFSEKVIPESSEEIITHKLDQLNNSNLPKEIEEFNFVQPFQISISNTTLNLGDRVYVLGKSSNSTHKNGILRFFGYTKFSDGIWAGIELDNPIGKNDGSVNGVRYFSCKPQYGLFALEHKVKKMDQSTTKGFSRMDSFSKYGSNESVSSIASNFSSASRTRVRLGMNAVNTTNKFKNDSKIESSVDKIKSSRTNIKDIKDFDKTSSAIQNVLKEKEQHVEQLIREREIERVDLATSTAKIDELERNQIRNLNLFNEHKLIYDMKLNELQNDIYLVCQERDELLEKLDDSKKKVDDLLFRIEEKDIDGSDLENKTEENESQIFELNEKLALEREIREQIEKKLREAEYQKETKNDESKYIIQINDLEEKLKKMELELNEERNNSKVHSLTKLLDDKECHITNLQERLDEVKVLHLEERNSPEVSSLSKLLDEKVTTINDLQKRLDEIESLNYEGKLVQLELELKHERDNSKVPSLSKQLEEKEIVICELQQYLKEVKSMNLEDKIVKLELELTEERNNSKVTSLSILLEEKETAIQNLQQRLEDAKSLNLEEKLSKLELELSEANDTSKTAMLSKLLEENETVIRDLKERLEEKISLNLEEKIIKLESELAEERHNSKVPSLSKQLEEKEIVICDLQQRLEEIKSLNLEDKIVKLELELTEERNDSKVTELSSLLKEKEIAIQDLQQRLEDAKSLNLEEKLSKLELKLSEASDDSKILTFSKLLEEKETVIRDLQERLEEKISQNLEEKIIKLQSELAGVRNNSKVLEEKDATIRDLETERSRDSEEKIIKLETQILEMEKNYMIISKILEEKEVSVNNLQQHLKEVKSMNFEEKVAQLESELIEEKNSCESLTKILKVKEEVVHNLEQHIEDIESLNKEVKLMKTESETAEENNNVKFESLSKILEEKETIIDDLTNHLERVKSLNLEFKLTKLESELSDERNNSELLHKLLVEKETEIKGHLDRFEEMNTQYIATKKEIISMTNENKSLQSEIINLQSMTDDLKKQLSDLKNEITQIQLESTNKDTTTQKLDMYTQIEEESLSETQLKENLSMKIRLDSLITENDCIKSELLSLKEKSEAHYVEIKENQADYNILQQKFVISEQESSYKIDAIIKERDEFSKDLLFLREKFDILQMELTNSKDYTVKLTELNSQIKKNEDNLKTKIIELENQINEFKKENNDLSQNLENSQNDATRESVILQMSLKIDDLESSLLQSSFELKSEKEQNLIRDSEKRILQDEVEHLKEKRDYDDNILHNQLESLKSINQMLENDKQILTDSMGSKSKELIVIRDRLLKTSQEHESLQEEFAETTQRLDSEKRLLNDKIRKIEKQLDENEKKSQFSLSDSADKRKNDGSNHISLLKAAKENSEQQISFLNSVIIDREKKVNGLQQENQILKDKIKDFESRIIEPVTKPKKVIPPRLYCDNCEIFDSHDTENCTIIPDDNEPSSPQLVLRQVKLNVKTPRLYCDICEIFDDHETEECQDQQTF